MQSTQSPLPSSPIHIVFSEEMGCEGMEDKKEHFSNSKGDVIEPVPKLNKNNSSETEPLLDIPTYAKDGPPDITTKPIDAG